MPEQSSIRDIASHLNDLFIAHHHHVVRDWDAASGEVAGWRRVAEDALQFLSQRKRESPGNPAPIDEETKEHMARRFAMRFTDKDELQDKYWARTQGPWLHVVDGVIKMTLD